MILSFRDKASEIFWMSDGRLQGPFACCARSAMRKLRMLDAAVTLADLHSPPGNRLEALTGRRHGQCSIRINDQYRVCFVWTPEGARDVEVVDYH